MLHSRVPKTFSPQTTGSHRNIKTGILMIWLQWVLGAVLWADEFAITHFDASGRLTFTEVSGAASYRVEWSATLAPGSWTSEPPGIDSIPAEGSGERTVTVAPGAGPVFFRVLALMEPPPPAGFVLIPGGVFSLGDSSAEGSGDERPVSRLRVAAFFLQTKETTWQEWDEVVTWARTQGYSFESPGQAKALDHPAVGISWHDAVKWCNARSEKEGLTPCYYSDEAQTSVYRSGRVNVSNSMVKWSANGFRLPTEAEWEKAARGGVEETRFPVTNTISHSLANYLSSNNFDYDTNPTDGYHPAYANGPAPYTSPVGSFAANGYGLFDMAGNAYELCWDWYASDYYQRIPTDDPRGPASGSSRIVRGGSWSSSAFLCRVACRGSTSPHSSYDNVGFRPVRGK